VFVFSQAERVGNGAVLVFIEAEHVGSEVRSVFSQAQRVGNEAVLVFIGAEPDGNGLNRAGNENGLLRS